MRKIVTIAGLAGLLLLGAQCSRGGGAPAGLKLLNVSYDPTRELWRDVNEHFIAKYQAETGTELTIHQSHGGSSTQARAVIDGLEADVVTLASYIDTDAIAQKGLIQPGAINPLRLIASVSRKEASVTTSASRPSMTARA